MKYFLLILFVLYASSYAISPLEINTVFKQGDDGYHTFRIPALLAVPDGPLLAFCEGRVWSRWDRGDIDVVLKRSFDGGKTWGSLQLIWSRGEETCGNPTAVYDVDTQRIWLLMSNNQNTIVDPTFSSNDAVVRDGPRKVWICHSDDFGANWSVPLEISEDVQPIEMQPPFNYWDALGPGAGIQLKHGIRKGRLVIPAVGRNIYSDDHGGHWTYGGLLSNGTNEATVVELSDGRLMRNDRADAGGVYGSYYRRMISYSYNRGISWSQYQPQDELITPICHAAMKRYQASDSLNDNNILLFSGPDSTVERVRMAVKVSENEGASWRASKVIYNDNAAYSSLAVLDDDTICLFYENGDGWPYHRISVARFSLDWLFDTTIALWDFDEKAAGQVASTASGAIKDSLGYELNATAEAAFSYVNGYQSGATAIDFADKDDGIVLPFENAKGIMDFSAEDSFLIRTMIQTQHHGLDDDPGAIVSKDSGSGNPQWWLRIENGKVRFHINDGNDATSIWSNNTVNDGQWHYIVVGRDAKHKQMHISIDHQIETTVTDSTTQDLSNTLDVVVGGFNLSTTRYFDGKIDFVHVMKYPDISRSGDLNTDGNVDYLDLLILAQNWLLGA